MAELGLDLDELLARRRSRGSATAASAGSPRASSTRWPRSRFPRSATASATSSASSIRRSSTAGRSRRPTSGCASATPGRSRAPNGPSSVKFGGYTEHYIDEQERPARALGAAHRSCWRPLRHADPRLPRQHRQHLAPVERRGARVVRLRGLQQRRLLRRGQPEGRLGEPQQGALPERRELQRQGAAPRAAVLLRLLLAAGHAAHPAHAEHAARAASTRSSPSS